MNRGLLETVLYAAVIVGVIAVWIRQTQRLYSAKRWPETQGTIESGIFETVERVRGVAIVLPVFAFSYVVKGEYYSGRFSLLPYSNDVGEAIVKIIVGRKVSVRYDPLHPEQWFVAEPFMEGYKVEQKIGPHLQHFYPSS